MKKFLLRNSIFIILFALGVLVPSALAVQLGGAGDQNGDAQGFMPFGLSAKMFIQSPAVAGAGTITSTGTGVVGTGTNFQVEILIGDSIIVEGNTRRVLSVSDNLNLIISDAFPSDVVDAVYQSAHPLFVIDNTGKVGIGTDLPADALTVTGRINAFGGVTTGRFVADPCGGGTPDGTMFFNDTSNSMCFCSGGVDLKTDLPAVACF